MKRKTVARVLALLLGTALIAGCGASSGGTSGGTSGGGAESSAESADTQDAAQEATQAASAEASADAQTGTETTETEGGEKTVVALVADGCIPDQADPATSNGDFRLFEMIYEPLVKYGMGGEIEPQLAESWEISEDGTIYTFHLRQDVKFSDGTDFNADSVLMNAERWAWDSFSATLLEVNKIDDYTVEFVFEAAAYPCMIEFTYPRPRRFAAADSFDADGNFVQMIGTGEWMVESFVPQEEVVLVPNPHYYGDAPKVDKVILRQVPDGQSRFMALQSGEADIAISDIPTENMTVLEGDPSLDVMEVEGTLAFFLIENYENEKLQDINVRQALNYAVDNETIANALLDGYADPGVGLMTMNTPYVTSENTKGYPYDPEKAKELLAASGYEDTDGDGIVEKDGEPLSLRLTFQTEEYAAWKTVCEYLQSEMAKVGIGIELNQVESGAYYDAIWDTRDFDLIIYRTYEDSWNPHGFIQGMFYQAEGAKAVCWYDKELSDDINAVLKEIDETKRAEGWDKIFRTIDENAYTVPLYYPKVLYAHNTRLSGLTQAPTTYEAVEWHLLDKTE